MTEETESTEEKPLNEETKFEGEPKAEKEESEPDVVPKKICLTEPMWRNLLEVAQKNPEKLEKVLKELGE